MPKTLVPVLILMLVAVQGCGGVAGEATPSDHTGIEAALCDRDAGYRCEPDKPPAPPATIIGSERVLVVFNDTWTADNDGDGTQDSRQIAEYYARKRGVPAQNLLGLSISLRHWALDSGFYTTDQ